MLIRVVECPQKEPDSVEVLVILLPLFLIFPVVFVVLIAVSMVAKRREAEKSKASSPETRHQ